MPRYIDLSDEAKDRVQRAAAQKVDWDAALKDCRERAEAIKASGEPAHKIARRLESLRIEYRSLLRSKHFAHTGINILHVGLDN
jgi:hypothetical protein